MRAHAALRPDRGPLTQVRLSDGFLRLPGCSPGTWKPPDPRRRLFPPRTFRAARPGEGTPTACSGGAEGEGGRTRDHQRGHGAAGRLACWYQFCVARGKVTCHSSKWHQVFCTRSVLGPRRVGWVPGC